MERSNRNPEQRVLSRRTIRQLCFLAAGFGAYLFAVHAPDSRFLSGFWMFAYHYSGADFFPNSQVEERLREFSLGYVLFAPLVFFATAIARIRYKAALMPQFARLVLWPIVIIGFVDIFASFLLGAFGTSAAGVVGFLVALTVFCWSCLFLSLLAGCESRGSIGCLTKWHRFLLAPILVISIWSTFSGLAAGLQAVWIANGRPYCIAKEGRSPYETIDSVFDLRGTNLFTSRTGYKDTDRQYFHAFLVVATLQGERHWNWSIASMRFDRLERFAPNPVEGTSACVPEDRFLERLTWL